MAGVGFYNAIGPVCRHDEAMTWKMLKGPCDMRDRESARAVVLLSGGLDSATTLAIAKHEGYEVHALTLCYGQRHGVEVEAAKLLAQAAGVAKHLVLDLDLRAIGGSALTDWGIEVPRHGGIEGVRDEIPATYVPARNTVFLSLALGWAEVLGAFDLFIGANAVDYSGYPDCRPQFLQAFERLANLATKAGVEGTGRFKIHAPLLELSKAQIIQRGMELGVDFVLTRSCYDPDEQGRACGGCDACLLRLRGFAECGRVDPAVYRQTAAV